MYKYIIYTYIFMYMCGIKSIFIVVSSNVQNFTLYKHIKVTSIHPPISHTCVPVVYTGIPTNGQVYYKISVLYLRR